MSKPINLERLSQLSIYKDDDRPAVLMLEDGTAYWGHAFGAARATLGEIVFNTGMTGYQEILTDPSYAGQIVTLTYPEIGNYGVNAQDFESRAIFARGLVVKRVTDRPSSFRSQANLDEYLTNNGIAGIFGVDTRALTRRIRDKGAMRACILTDKALFDQFKIDQSQQNRAKIEQHILDLIQKSPQMSGQDCTAEVTIGSAFNYSAANPALVAAADKETTYRVAVFDFGIKENILRELTKRGIDAQVFPARTAAQEILKGNFDGLFLSNGPGDPAACEDIVQQLQLIVQTGLPTFGICLGHQLLSLAFGARTYKLKFGHRGGNQPVKDLTTGKIEVTSQNHGFAVDETTLPDDLELTHINLNDQSCEGFRHKTLPVFCVQYHPESSPGPHDSSYLFDRFVDLIKANKH
jgi:carbamoyl-phosphate synthase small subunit